MNNKIISIWGNPNSGKTIFSLKLAKELSKQNKNVILILCDPVVPAINTIMPSLNTKNKSLGKLLSSIELTQDKILKNCIKINKNDYLSVLSYLHGENEKSYAKYSKERTEDLFILLKHLADYIIIDCSSLISNDILSLTALEKSDKVIRLISADLKSISFFDSNLRKIGENKYNIGNHIKVLSNIKCNMAKDQVGNRYGGVIFELPYLEEIETQYYEGQLFEKLKDKKSEIYTDVLKEIIFSIFEEEIKPKKIKMNFLNFFKKLKR